MLTYFRYITIQSGHRPSLTRSFTKGIHDTDHVPWPTGLDKDTRSPLWQLSRIFEASTLLDNIHNVLHNPTSEYAFNVEEIGLLVETSYSLRTLLIEEVEDADQIYSGGLGLCHTLVEPRSSFPALLEIFASTLMLHSGLLLAYENGTKVQITDGQALTCQSIATSSLKTLLTTISNTVSPFVSGTQAIDFDRLPPFIIFLVYKAAGLVTERMWMEADSSEALRTLRILRGFLKLVNARWLCCGTLTKSF